MIHISDWRQDQTINPGELASRGPRSAPPALPHARTAHRACASQAGPPASGAESVAGQQPRLAHRPGLRCGRAATVTVSGPGGGAGQGHHGRAGGGGDGGG